MKDEWDVPKGKAFKKRISHIEYSQSVGTPGRFFKDFNPWDPKIIIAAIKERFHWYKYILFERWLSKIVFGKKLQWWQYKSVKKIKSMRPDLKKVPTKILFDRYSRYCEERFAASFITGYEEDFCNKIFL